MRDTHPNQGTSMIHCRVLEIRHQDLTNSFSVLTLHSTVTCSDHWQHTAQRQSLGRGPKPEEVAKIRID